MTEVRESETLLSRIRVIEDQVLEDRAAGFAGLHDELQRRLEGDSRSPA